MIKLCAMEKKTVFLWLATILFWGISPILEKIGLQRVEPIVGLFIRTIFVLIAVTIFLFITSDLEKLRMISLRDLLILGLSGITAGFLGMYTYFSLLKTHQASLIVPLTATYPLVVTILAVSFLREPVTPSKLLGTALIVLGIYFLFRESS